MVEFRKIRARRVVLGLFLVGPPALYEVRDGTSTTVVPSSDLRAALGTGGRHHQELDATADRLHAASDPSWVQVPYGGVVADG